MIRNLAFIGCLSLSTAAVGAAAYAQASQPASQPSQQVVSAAVLQARVTIIMEVDENHLKVQESWQIDNPTGGSVPKEQVVFDLGPGIRRLQMDEEVTDFVPNDAGSLIRAKVDLGPGSHGFAGSYLLDKDGDSAAFTRTLPVPVRAGRLITEDINGLAVDGSTAMTSRVSDLNGLSFRVFDFAALPVGHAFQVRVSGLPSRSALPRNIAVVVSILAFVWMLVGVLKPRVQEPVVLSALSAEARREQLVKALELLEEDRLSGRVEPDQAARRKKALMMELAAILREMDLRRQGHS